MAEINSNELPTIDAEAAAAITVEKLFEETIPLLERHLSSGTDDSSGNSAWRNQYAQEGSNLNATETQPSCVEIDDGLDQQTLDSVINELQLDATSTTAETRDASVDGNNEADTSNSEKTMTIIQLLLQQNNCLLKRVHELESLTEYIMSKYRQSVTYFLNQANQNTQQELKMMKEDTERMKTPVDQDIVQVMEMKEVMFQAARMDDNLVFQYEELLSRLKLENKGLREMLRISSTFGNIYLSSKANKAIQTDDLEDSLVFSEDESFHTAAKSLAGSVNSSSQDEYCSDSNHSENGSIRRTSSVVQLLEKGEVGTTVVNVLETLSK